MRLRVWQIVEPSSGDDPASRFFDIGMSTVIVMAVLAVVLESVEPVGSQYATAFTRFEIFCLVVFGSEYLVRLWACKSDSRFAGRFGRVRWMISLMALVDLAAILPGLVLVGSMDLRFLRSVRLIRLFRLGRYSSGMKIIANAFTSCRQQMTVALAGVGILLLISSSALYYAERAAQPDAFGSIPSAMWWGICTLTTVGYGDVYPVTATGKLLASGIALLGVGTFAIPAGILAAHFEQAMGQSVTVCPHCGNEFDG